MSIFQFANRQMKRTLQNFLFFSKHLVTEIVKWQKFKTHACTMLIFNK